MEDQLQKINVLREKAETFKSEKERITGRIETQQQRLAQIESECKEKFECSIEELPALADSLKKESDDLISEAEGILKESEESDG